MKKDVQTSLGRFTTIDPLAEKYPSLSPYAYCNGNPVNFVDPDGRAIEEKNKKEWDKLYKIITKTASRVQRRIDKLESKGKTGSRLSYLKDRLSSINETLSTMKKLENSKHTYSLSHANGSIGEVSYPNGQIDINYIAGSVSNFVHELTHAGQFESGDIGFNRTTGAVYAQDIFDEVAAYRSQEYYSGNKVSHINADYVAGMTDKDGNRIYTLGGYSNTASVPVSVNTPYDEVAKAYLVRNIANEERPYHMVVDMYFNESQK